MPSSITSMTSCSHSERFPCGAFFRPHKRRCLFCFVFVVLLRISGTDEVSSFAQEAKADTRSAVRHEDKLSPIGRETAIVVHLDDGQEYGLSIPALLDYGRLLFNANWTADEGGGRPLTKGTGRPLSDPSLPLKGSRAFNRISAPDANSCAGCHNAPFGISGGAGDIVANVFVLGQRFDFVTFEPSDKLPTRGAADEEGEVTGLATMANQRATTGLFG